MILEEAHFGNIITESTEDKKIYLKGIFMESEQKNRNGRIYQRSEIEKAVNKVNEAAKAGRHILGELDHPPSLEVRLENVSHKIVDMYMEGNNAIGRAEILVNTPKGQIAKGLIEAGVNLGVSSRGTGSVNENTGMVEGFEVVTVDLVAQPSAINAYPETLSEHLQFYKRYGELTDVAEALIRDTKAQKFFKEEINKFLKDLYK